MRLTLTGGTGVTLSTTGPLSATGTFANDDVPPTVSVARVGTATAVAEGDPAPGSEEGGAFAFTVTRSGQTDKFATSVIFSLLSPDGSLGADDLLRVTDAGNTITPDASGLFTLTFAAGETSRTLTITARADAAVEPDARFTLAVENVSDGTLAGPSSFEGSFTNDDVPPTISVERLGAIAVAEGNPSPGPGGEAGADFAFAFTRTGQADKFASTVNFRIVAQTAGFTADDILRVTLGGNTLTPDAGGVYTLAFAAGDTAATIVVTARADTTVEADDSFQFIVESPTGASLEGATGFVATILDDDNAAPVGVADRVGTTRNTGVTFDILANDIDVDGDTLFAGDFTRPANGTLAINGGLVTYTPRAGFSGTDSFTYRPFDGTLQGDVTTVTIDVSGPDGDVLIGTPGPDTLNGLGGNDTIIGLASADRLIGNVGDDSIAAGAGNDTLFGNGGRDTLAGGADDDRIAGGIGDDSLLGEAGRDALSGDAGNDTLRGGDDADTLSGAADDDLLDGGEGDDIATGGAGADTLLGLGGDDTLRGANGNDSVLGGAGRDTLNGGADNDTLLGGTEADSLAGGLGNDSLAGEEGDDTLGAGEGNDTARGGDGRDLLRGADGDDLLFGDRGDDRLVGGAGADTIEGGADDGAILFGPSFDPTGFIAGDVIDLRSPGGGGDGQADLIIYRFGLVNGTFVSDGLDRVLGFEGGVDRILILAPEGGSLDGLAPGLRVGPGGNYIFFFDDFGPGLVVDGTVGVIVSRPDLGGYLI